jgi:hypothetical protein
MGTPPYIHPTRELWFVVLAPPYIVGVSILVQLLVMYWWVSHGLPLMLLAAQTTTFCLLLCVLWYTKKDGRHLVRMLRESDLRYMQRQEARYRAREQSRVVALTAVSEQDDEPASPLIAPSPAGVGTASWGMGSTTVDPTAYTPPAKTDPEVES